MEKKIKWGCIQPLTGGMYLGARNAIGHPAAWIISYPGLTDVKLKKDGTQGAVGNEYNLLAYLKKHNELPPYKVFNRAPFGAGIDTNNVELNDVEGWSFGDIDFTDTDIVVSVPVCSGLSQATIATEETKQARNCNMLFNVIYSLEVIKPKVYIFENAPLLFNSKTAEPVRDQLNDIAIKYGYSIIYYKTDTQLHDNCQRRPRTFVIFVKSDKCPVMYWENIKVSVKEYLDRISKDATQQVTVDMGKDNVMLLDYIKQKYGKNYRTEAHRWTIGNIINNNLWEDFYNFIDNYDTEQTVKDRMKHICDHIQYKISLDKNFYVLAPAWIEKDAKTTVACMFKAIPTILHPEEDRLLTIREWLHIMGHPDDFEMYGDINANYSKIGQNVPVRTAQWIVSEACRFLTDNNVEYTDSNIAFFDNIKQKIM